MRVIIAGSRTVTDYNIVKTAVKNSGWFNHITLIISGCAKGVDQLGIKFADEYNISKVLFPANWNKYGKRAGYIRNIEMAHFGDALIAIHKDNSKGTTHMIRTMLKKTKLVYVHKL